MVGIFFYVGLEISLFANAIKFFETQGIDNKDTVALLASFYPLAMMIGRFAGTFVMKVIKAERLLVILGIFGVALLIVGMVSTGLVAVWCLILCGLANSIMYPTIFALGIAELGPLTSKGSGVITLGNFGGASHSSAVRPDGRQDELPARVPAAHRGLSLHRFLRPVGV